LEIVMAPPVSTFLCIFERHCGRENLALLPVDGLSAMIQNRRAGRDRYASRGGRKNRSRVPNKPGRVAPPPTKARAGVAGFKLGAEARSLCQRLGVGLPEFRQRRGRLPECPSVRIERRLLSKRPRGGPLPTGYENGRSKIPLLWDDKNGLAGGGYSSCIGGPTEHEPGDGGGLTIKRSLAARRHLKLEVPDLPLGGQELLPDFGDFLPQPPPGGGGVEVGLGYFHTGARGRKTAFEPAKRCMARINSLHPSCRWAKH